MDIETFDGHKRQHIRGISLFSLLSATLLLLSCSKPTPPAAAIAVTPYTPDCSSDTTLKQIYDVASEHPENELLKAARPDYGDNRGPIESQPELIALRKSYGDISTKLDDYLSKCNALATTDADHAACQMVPGAINPATRSQYQYTPDNIQMSPALSGFARTTLFPAILKKFDLDQKIGAFGEKWKTDLVKENEQAWANAMKTAEYTATDIRVESKDDATKAVTCVANLTLNIATLPPETVEIHYKMEVTSDGLPYISLTGI